MPQYLLRFDRSYSIVLNAPDEDDAIRQASDLHDSMWESETGDIEAELYKEV